ncbi:DinB family protein (plasmid) [Cytobacillus spongiae]|uniref:DinB family protein n=1 Tax=Cytobacillus spongiae TaxID=2901381 RepID=UPI001F418F2D|nr:DinB family protein [Cytobacillus spongiae]UII58244.1 DinB family protein [Cytobacillus spongiae]
MEKEIELIEAIRSDVLNSVHGLTDEECNTRFKNSRWTIIQVLEHLYLMETSLTKAMKTTLSNGEEQDVPSKPIHYTLDRSTKVDAPPFVTPTKEFQTLHEVTAKLESSRKNLLKFLNHTNKELLQKKAYPHPVFGLIRLDEWVPFIGYHEKRHLGQIEEMKKSL